MKISEMNPVEQSNWRQIIMYTEGLFRNGYLESYKAVIKASLLISSGGVIAMLTYYRNSDSRILALLSLSLFLLSLIFIFYILYQDHKVCDERFFNFMGNARNFYEGRLGINEVFSTIKDTKILKKKLWCVGHFSILFMIVGIVLGLLSLFV